MLISSLFGFYYKKGVTSVFDILPEQIEKIEVISTYKYKIPVTKLIIEDDLIISHFISYIKKSTLIDTRKEYRLWYINLKITLNSSEELYIRITKKEQSYVFNQVYKFIIIQAAGNEYIVSDKIIKLF
jgi:hypothetical protein